MDESQFSRDFVLSGQTDDRVRAQDALFEAITAVEFDESTRFAIRLALEEALSNAFKHGNKNDPDKVVRMAFRVDAERIEISVEDEGEGFDPGAVPDPTQSENLDLPSGRGIVLMRSFMSEVSYDPPGNRVRLTYRKSQAG
jgi:serine/threonine-protein kinase RsbW